MNTEKEWREWRVFGKLFCFVPCDGRDCEYTFHAGELRYGRETVGRGWGFYCETCFEEHCPGRSWEKAETLLVQGAQLFLDAAGAGISDMLMKRVLPAKDE